MTILYEDNDIIVKSTGHDYDFIATVENKTDKDINIVFCGEEYCDMFGIAVDANDWTGILADPEGYEELEQLQNGNFEITTEEVYDL